MNMSYPMFHPSSGRTPPTTLSPGEFASEFPAESQYVEFKEGAPHTKIAETACAYSNTDGGVILLGVSDNGEIRGINLSAANETKIRNTLSQVRDLGLYRIHRFEVAGRKVIAIGVARRRDGFAQLANGQIKERRGASNHTLMGAALTDFITRRFIHTVETAPTQQLHTDIDPDLSRELASAWQWPVPSSASSPEFLDILHDNGFLVHDSGNQRLSVVGALYLMTDSAQALGKTFIEIFRYRDAGLDYDRREEFRGPLQSQVSAATEFVLNELGFDLAMLGVTRHELHRLPRVVMREAIANAVAHRSYGPPAIAEAVRIEMRPDRVVVRSPGALPDGVSLNRMVHQSVPRNVLTIRTLRYLGIAEDAGRGIALMNDHMALNLMATPRFEADENSVTATLLLGSSAMPEERAWLQLAVTNNPPEGTGPYSVGDFGSANSGIKPQDAVLLLKAARGETLTNARARELLGTDVGKAREALQRLRDFELLHQQGSGSGTSYVLAPRLVSLAGGSRVSTRPRDFEAEIMELAHQGNVTNAVVRARTGLDRVAALRILNRLVATGRLEREGTRRGSHYVLHTGASQVHPS